MLCPQCGATNPATAGICRQCGAATAVSDAAAPMSASRLQPDQGATGEGAAGNVIARHWRGDYSLGVAYWIFGSLLTLVTVALMALLGDLAKLREFGPRASGATILGVYVFVAVFSLWQFIGIWRAATRHRERSGKAAWAALAKVMIVVGLLRTIAVFIGQGLPQMAEAVRLLAGIDDTPAYALRLLHAGKELELSGGMPFGTTAAVKAMLDAHPGIDTLHLNSRGGRVNEGFLLFRLVRERKLDTYTSVECASACTIVFLAGRQRYLGAQGRLGFHSASLSGSGGAAIAELNADVRRIMEQRGIPASFIERAISTPPDAIWYPDVDALFAANVIDAVGDPHAF